MTKFLLPLILFLSALAAGQTNVTVSATNIHDSGNNKLATGVIYFAPVDSTGHPIGYQAGGGGQVITWPTTMAIINGAFSGLLANGALTNPVNVCFAVTVKNNRNQIVLGGFPNSGYQCLQTATSNFWCAAGACNFDQYFPQANGIPIVPTPPPSVGSLGGIYAMSCTSPQLVQGYDANGRPVCTNAGSGTGNVVGPSTSIVGDVAAFNNLLGGLLLDTGLPFGNLVTQTINGAANQVCTYTGANKVCVPGNVSNAALANSNVTISTTAPLAGGGVVNLGGALSLTIGNIPNADLANSTIGVNGTTSQITSSNSNPPLGGATTLAIANPFTFPGKTTLAAATVSASSMNIPSGVAPTTPNSGDIWNISGVPKFFNGASALPFVLGPLSSTSNNIAAFGGSNGASIADSGISFTNLVTQSVNGAANQVCTYTAANKVCIPGTVPNAALANASVTINTAAPLAGGGAVALGSSLSLTIANIPNTALTNSTIGIGGTANQITSSNTNPALGGTTTIALANPLIFPGKATAAASTSAAASLNIPSGVAPTTPVSGDLWNASGVPKFFDGATTYSLAFIQGALTTNDCIKAGNTINVLTDAGAPCGSGTGGSSITVNGGAPLATPVNFQNGSAVNGVSVNASNPSGANVQFALSGTMNNSGLTNSSITVNTQAVSLGSAVNIPFQTAGVNNTSLNGLNFVASAADAVGLHIAASNPSASQERFEITGASYTGNAATATALATVPSQCTGSQFAIGIAANGNANCSTPSGSGGSASPNQSISFTAATSASLTVLASTANITWACWDNSNPANAIYPSNVTVNPSTFLVTFNFLTNQSGYCAVNSTGSGVYSAAQSGNTWSIPASTHNMGSSVLVDTFDTGGNRVFGNVAVDNSGNVTVSWLMSQTGKVVIAP